MQDIDAILETGGAAAAELAASALASRSHCANCGAVLTGRFCAVCGQSVDNHRRSVRHLVSDLIKDVVSFDSRILRTTVALLFRPGELALAFREGRTQRYVPPVRLYLFVSLLFFLALEISNIALIQFVLHAEPSTKAKIEIALNGAGSKSAGTAPQNHYNINSSTIFLAREGSVHPDMPPDAVRQINDKMAKKLQKAHSQEASFVNKTVFGTILKLANDPAALNGALTAWMPRALFLLLPIFALILALFYWRQHKTLYFVDHLVFSLGFHTFAFVALLAAAGLAQFAGGGKVLLAMSLVQAVYLLFAMKKFYSQSWFWTGAKWLSVTLIYTFFCVFPAIAGVIVAAVLWG
jgi:Predicted membrane-associated, metal-dependent hydrolase